MAYSTIKASTFKHKPSFCFLNIAPFKTPQIKGHPQLQSNHDKDIIPGINKALIRIQKCWRELMDRPKK
uniref:Uncharacterized protein n=1 Tax=Rhizophora mucronata TaxID=61149 RepID=A0A2P2QP75_RHIMU